jgi:integrase/recombinase XerD
MTTTRDGWTAEDVLAAFDEHLRRARGVCAGTRLNYGRSARAFLEAVTAGSVAEIAAISAQDVGDHVGDLARRYRPPTVALAATGLRSFLRFLRAEGLRGDRLEEAVPMVPCRRSGLVRHLEPERLEQLIASLDTSCPRGLRDRAIIVCMARLGMRTNEITRLQLEDLDWRNATIRVRSRKTGHGAMLPMTAEAGAALAAYLRDGRPGTASRAVFVLHWLRPGAPVSSSIVGRAVGNALERAGIDAPARGGNLLRHSLATGLLARGASLQEIGSVLGHSSLATTQIYARVDAAALRECALPWPGAAA